jgi:hypothetical protein
LEAYLKEIKLPSGAILKCGENPFEVSLALKEALYEEIKNIPFDKGKDVTDLIKNLVCTAFSSPKIKKCLWDCFPRYIYSSEKGDLKIDKDTFQPVQCRQDYETVCMEVTKEEVLPFGKEGFVKFAQVLSEMLSSPESK